MGSEDRTVPTPPPPPQASIVGNVVASSDPPTVPLGSPEASQGGEFVPLPPLFLATTVPSDSTLPRLDSPPQLPTRDESSGVGVPQVDVGSAPSKPSSSASNAALAATSPAPIDAISVEMTDERSVTRASAEH